MNVIFAIFIAVILVFFLFPVTMALIMALIDDAIKAWIRLFKNESK